jgi:uncharacterized iron-regulated membrane protein
VSFRSLVLVTHRWIGLASSLVLVVLGVTGAILVVPGRSMLRKLAQPLHERLWIGQFGWWIVVVTTIAAVLLQLGGLILWWKRKRVAVRFGDGPRRGLTDLHHASGAIAFVLMFLLAATGVLMAFITPREFPELRRIVFNLHTTRSFPIPIRLVYFLGSIGFAVQGVTGVFMWWRPSRALRDEF